MIRATAGENEQWETFSKIFARQFNIVPFIEYCNLIHLHESVLLNTIPNTPIIQHHWIHSVIAFYYVDFF